jgi:gamma-glutamyl:cysteine ligase YbdK (ATP-grasp superfamily)
MSEIETFLESEAERKMRESFDKQVNDVLENEDRYEKNYDDTKVGLEVEYPAVDENFHPVPSSARNEVVEQFEFTDLEVGATQVEIKTEPLKLSNLAELENTLKNRENALLEVAESKNAQLLRSGTNPVVEMDEIEKTDKPKYETVPAFHDKHRNGIVQESFGKIESIDPQNADIAALINSTQTNIEADNFDEAVEKANYTYMITPFLSAISTNSRFIGMKDTGYSDTRMPLWEKSHDLRSEEDLGEEPVSAGKLDSYYTSLEDYFDRVREEPFILHEEEAAMDIGIGTFWKDSRIKFRDEPENDIHDVIVESRAVSTQPTIEEEIAMHGFLVGRLAYAQEEDEELMDIERVNRNRYTAMFNGLDEKLYSTEGEHKDAAEVLREELQKAEQGLEYAGIESDGYLELLYDRLDSGTPSDQMAEGFYDALENGSDRRDALKQGLENQRGGLENTTDAK